MGQREQREQVGQKRQIYGGIPLFPNPYKRVGYLFILIAIGTAYLYFWGGRPSFFEVPVFAVITSYAETRWFVLAQTNLLDELAHLFLISGLVMIAFSKELHETKVVQASRIRALFYAVYITSALWIAIYLTVYGWPIVVISATIFVLLMVLFILIFKVLLFRNNIAVSKTKT